MAETINIDVYQLGQSVYDQAFKETGKIVYDENLARIALIAGFVSGQSVLLAGSPGGAKTTLAKNMYRLGEGWDESSFANLPSSANLTEEDIMGGSITTTKRFEKEEDGKITKWTETTENTIKPLINSDTYGVFADEITRTSPWALNALLSAMEDHRLVTNSGIVELPNFQTMIATMNPAEGREATFPVGLALASRFAIGVVMGNDLSDTSKDLLQDGILPDPTKVNPVFSIPQLAIMRQTIDRMHLPTKNKDSRRRKLETVERTLNRELNGLSEKGRLYLQVGRTAKTLALFDGTGMVSDSHFDNAIYFAMGSRVGARTRDIQSAPEVLRALHTEVLEAA